ncbi:UPF0481 protein At3g47200-like isoform X2 [Vigna radiata var. radiata]|uniref:UPF0481 protein At3g47200-like isoform X2 n=1 Tax=Vigna radiata var. radiata TaxID=3916 RepID=A0A1S3VXQ9_VIGRR|nr:UPF0481 protein At3g47200-like isoform X2 [Vigna radiata var. radiata]
MEGESSYVTIEIERLEREWIEMLQNVKPPEMDEIYMQSIYRVPQNIRQNNPKVYTPLIFTIGPYHHNSLETTKKLKLKYLKGFLNRTQLPMRVFVEKIKEMEERNIIRNCYADTIECNDNFLKMILVDACFIIELFLRSDRKSEWKEKDPLIQKPRMLGFIELDLLLLENQLPFCVLEQLYKLTGMNEKFLDITLNYFENRLFGNVRPRESPKHFTDLLRSSIISSSKLGLEKLERCNEVKHVYSASQLMEAGLAFEVSPYKSFIDLTYSKHGVLTMPILNIHDNTELLFRNMMAYEHCHLSSTNIITQYVVILAFLIDTEKDVNLLVEKKIIVNWTGDAKKVATMFNNLTSQLSIPDFNSHYFSICNSLNEFYENPGNKYKAIFIHEYFNTPWKIASTTAAIVLLLLTFIQTVCSIISVVQSN